MTDLPLSKSVRLLATRNPTLNRVILFCITTVIFYSIIINNFLKPRVFQLTDSDFIETVTSGFANSQTYYFAKIITGLLIGIFYLLIITHLNKKISKGEILISTALIIMAVPPVLSYFFATTHSLSFRVFLLPACIASLMFLEYKDLNWFIKHSRYFCLVYMYGSLVYTVLFPTNAIDFAYGGGVLWNFRLFGLATHANHLAPVAFVFFLINKLYEKKSKLNYVHYTASIGIILATQSKTTWVAIAVILMFLAMARMKTFLSATVFFSILCPCATVICYLLLNIYLQQTISESNFDSIFTLTGRDVVWKYVTDLWRSNPWFGYGLDLWRDQSRINFLQIYNWAPGQSHNQLFQTLGQTGIVGVIALFFYVSCILYLATKYRKESNYILLTLVILILIRGISESSLESALFVESFIIQFITVGLIILYSKREDALNDTDKVKAIMLGNQR